MKQPSLSIIILTLLIVPELCFGASNCQVDKSVKTDLATKLTISEDEVCRVIDAITLQVIAAQNIITDIADSNKPYIEKIRDGGLIDQTIKDHYVNGDVLVQVTSKRSEDIKEYFIKAYLQHLADLSYKGIYNEVTLVYDQNNMKFIEINPLKGDTYLMRFQVFQYFKGCKSDNRGCYQDITDKNFFVEVEKPSSPDRKARISSISAMQTYDSN